MAGKTPAAGSPSAADQTESGWGKFKAGARSFFNMGPAASTTPPAGQPPATTTTTTTVATAAMPPADQVPSLSSSSQTPPSTPPPSEEGQNEFVQLTPEDLGLPNATASSSSSSSSLSSSTSTTRQGRSASLDSRVTTIPSKAESRRDFAAAPNPETSGLSEVFRRKADIGKLERQAHRQDVKEGKVADKSLGWGEVIKKAVSSPKALAYEILGSFSEELVNEVYETEGLADALYLILFDKPYQGRGVGAEFEELIGRWIGVDDLFEGLEEGDVKGRKIALLTAISLKLTGQQIEGSENGFIGNLTGAAVAGALNQFIDGICPEDAFDESGRGRRRERMHLVNAVSFALTGKRELDDREGGLVGNVIKTTVDKMSLSLFGRELHPDDGGLVGAFRKEMRASVWGLLFDGEDTGHGVISQMERAVEVWLGAEGLFERALDGVAEGERSDARKAALLTVLSMKLTGRPIDESKGGLVGNLTSAAVAGALNEFIDSIRPPVVGGEERPRLPLVQSVAEMLTDNPEIIPGKGLAGTVVSRTVDLFTEATLGRRLKPGESYGAVMVDQMLSGVSVATFKKDVTGPEGEGLAAAGKGVVSEMVDDAMARASQGTKDLVKELKPLLRDVLRGVFQEELGRQTPEELEEKGPNTGAVLSSFLTGPAKEGKPSAAEHPGGLVGTLKDAAKEAVTEALAPVMDRIQPVIDLADHVADTVAGVNGVFGFAGRAPRAPVSGSGAPRLRETSPSSSSSSSSSLEPAPEAGNIVVEGEEFPAVASFDSVSDRLKKALQNIVSGAASSVPRVVVNMLASACKWGVLKVQENVPEENRAFFASLADDLTAIVEDQNPPSLDRMQAIINGLDMFSKKVQEQGVRITWNGIPIPLFLFAAKADFAATPTYNLAIARKHLEESRNPPVAANAMNIEKFKTNLSKYLGARFAYEVAAGLSPKDGFYNSLFANGHSDDSLKDALFVALDEAQAAGKISAIRVWITKILFYLIQPATSLFIKPFLDNVESKMMPILTDKVMIEATGQLLIDEFTNYLGSIINMFHDIAEGDMDKSLSIDAAMLEKTKDPKYNKGLTERMRNDQVIAMAVDEFAPGFRFASRIFDWLKGIGFDDKSSLSILNPLISCLKAIPYVLSFLFLYMPQEVMNWGLKWGIKTALSKGNVLDGVVNKAAQASASDLNMERARLKATQSFMLKMFEDLKNPVRAPLSATTGSKTEEKHISPLVSNFFLAKDYGSAKNVADLRRKVAEKSNPPKDAFSLFGVNINFREMIDEETHNRVVQHLSRSYRNAMDGDIIAEQASSVVAMLNGMFDANQPISADDLRKEVDQLQRENDALLSELISFAVAVAVEEQFDMTGAQEFEKLKATIGAIKTDVAGFATQTSAKLRTLDLRSANIDTLIEGFEDEAVRFGSKMTTHFENKNDLKKRFTEFSELLPKYQRILADLLETPTDELREEAIRALEEMNQWQEAFHIPTNINITLFQDKMQKIIGVVKGYVRDHARKQVGEMMDFMAKPYNVAGVANLGLTLFAQKKFPFQRDQ